MLLLLCLVLIVFCKWTSSMRLSELLSALLTSKVIKIYRTSEERFSLMVSGSLVIYTVSWSLLLYLVYVQWSDSIVKLNHFLIALTMASVFLLVKIILGKLVANLGDFETLYGSIDHQRNIYRAALGYVVLSLAVISIIVLKRNPQAIIFSLILAAAIVLLYHIIILYQYRRQIISSAFYFILYLCALEITPYLLLYKYFMV
ncbi:DUF4271 domain-containing protein [Nonlabens xiamenensis]|uniref:DUF4271 domain-containing protein n=1 Tax=Nonlabens xiamenensis TaxID=2341043 RepID=UPI0021D303FF|nr:DUF4271 domain-containing protein [Nonlabens xiamenensis]